MKIRLQMRLGVQGGTDVQGGTGVQGHLGTAAPAPGAFAAAGQREFFQVKKSSVLVLFLPPGIKPFQSGMAGGGGCSPGGTAPQSPSIPGDGKARGQALC